MDLGSTGQTILTQPQHLFGTFLGPQRTNVWVTAQARKGKLGSAFQAEKGSDGPVWILIPTMSRVVLPFPPGDNDLSRKWRPSFLEAVPL